MLVEFLKRHLWGWFLLNRLEIYKDDNMIVEIDGFFHYLLENMIVKNVKLTKNQYDFLINITLLELQINNFDCKNCNLIASSNAPIVEKYKNFELVEEFKILNEAFDYLSLIEDRSNKGEIADSLKSFYKDNDIPFYIIFYEKPLFKIDGCMVARENNNILITFFVFPD